MVVYTRGIYGGHHAQCPLVLRLLDALLVLRMFVRGHPAPYAWRRQAHEHGGGPALLEASLGHHNAMGGERKMKLRSVQAMLSAGFRLLLRLYTIFAYYLVTELKDVAA